MANRHGPTVELCSGNYYAEQVPGSVIIHALGRHMTGGYHVFFEQSLITVFPPEFSLWHVKPQGLVTQVIRPFAVHTNFPATAGVAKVAVHDANGKHEVPVDQARDVHTFAASGTPGRARLRAAAGVFPLPGPGVPRLPGPKPPIQNGHKPGRPPKPPKPKPKPGGPRRNGHKPSRRRKRN